VLCASLAHGDKYEAGPVFEIPAGWKAEASADVSAEHAVKLTPTDSKRPRVASILVLSGNKKVGDNELDAEANTWHAAHIKNRVAWGMRSDGGMPRESFRAGPRRMVRFRDKVGSAMGANEQTLTCTVIGARLACVIAHAAPDTREDADALTAAILGTLHMKKR
jgi:hypothetical protein